MLEDLCDLPVLKVSHLVARPLTSREASALRSCLEAGPCSYRGARAPTRHHCSNHSDALLRDTQEYAVATYKHKTWSPDLCPWRI